MNFFNINYEFFNINYESALWNREIMLRTEGSNDGNPSNGKFEPAPPETLVVLFAKNDSNGWFE